MSEYCDAALDKAVERVKTGDGLNDAEEYVYSIYSAIYDDLRVSPIIGYVGDTGQGEPGTRGQMIPHLHIQIGVEVEGQEDYLWVNPYNVVKFLEQYRESLVESSD